MIPPATSVAPAEPTICSPRFAKTAERMIQRVTFGAHVVPMI